jgi:signal transduction histidine kinase
LATNVDYPLPYLVEAGFVLPIVAVYWSIAARFVEEARTLERMRAKLASDVAERTRDLARAEQALSLAERLAALGRFANGVAHEVNNPASVVTANLRWLADALEAGDDRADMTEVVGESLESMRRINDLVRKLVDAGRIASATPGGSADLADAVQRAVLEYRARVPSVEFTTAVPADVWVRVRPESLSQVLSHLVANAAEAVPAGQRGHVSIQAERRPGTVRVQVSDDGRGMSAQTMRRAFEPFFTTKPEGQGAGLGLAISRGVVEGHGGSLWLESDEGRGTTATFELPESVPPSGERVA